MWRSGTAGEGIRRGPRGGSTNRPGSLLVYLVLRRAGQIRVRRRGNQASRQRAREVALEIQREVPRARARLAECGLIARRRPCARCAGAPRGYRGAGSVACGAAPATLAARAAAVGDQIEQTATRIVYRPDDRSYLLYARSISALIYMVTAAGTVLVYSIYILQ